MTRRSAPTEQGLTLIELVVAVAIMGIAFVTIVAGMMSSIFTSDVHRRQATTETVLKRLAETAQAASYNACESNPANYGLVAPTGYSVNVAFGYWDGTANAFHGAPCSGDQGLQKITLTVMDSSGRDAEGPVDLVKRRPT